MSIFHKKFGLILGFALLIALVFVNAAITRRQLGIQVEKRQLVARSQNVLLQISQTVSSLKDAETGQRGYLITYAVDYLEPYNEALREVHGHLRELIELTRDNPEQHQRAQKLQTLSERKLEELAEIIALAESGRGNETRELVLTSTGKKTMDQIRSAADEMWNAETALETLRRAEYERSTVRTVESIFGATLVAAAALVLFAFYIIRNLRERERAAALLRDREEWFRVTLGSIGDGVIATDSIGRVSFLNQVAENLIGATFAEIANKGIEEAFPIFNEVTHAAVANPVATVLEKGTVIGLANHTVLKHRDGRLIPIEDSAAPIRNDHQQIVGVVLVFRDASMDRQSREVMRRAEKLATAGRLAATMAHEINNPLEAVGNLLYLAKSARELSPATRAYLEQCESQLERVSHITRQTLGFYRESAGPTEVSMPAIIDSVLRLYDNKLRNKGITVERDFDQSSPVHGLAGELRQMVANLVSNAVDALPANGKLAISVIRASRNGSSGVELRVKDNGTGVPSENLERIFEPFFTTKADVGTGLGLWVTRQLAEHHGGTVEVESRTTGPEVGSVFTVFLPDATVASTSSGAAS